jgi:hypothetical protein
MEFNFSANWTLIAIIFVFMIYVIMLEDETTPGSQQQQQQQQSNSGNSVSQIYNEYINCTCDLYENITRENLLNIDISSLSTQCMTPEFAEIQRLMASGDQNTMNQIGIVQINQGNARLQECMNNFTNRLNL